MKTFKDNAGRTWTVGIDVAAIKRVRSLLDVDLMGAVEGKLLERLVSDPVLLCDVIYVVCKPEADAQNVSDEDFGRAMAGDAIEHATTALLEELVDFFPQGKRRVLHKALAKLQAVEARAVEYAQARLEDPELDRRIEAALNSPTDLSSSLPPSSE
jgi:NAD-dependent oxidoreductase involved in siderophore biosynthesis